MMAVQRLFDWLLGWSLLLLASLVWGALWLIEKLLPVSTWED